MCSCAFDSALAKLPYRRSVEIDWSSVNCVPRWLPYCFSDSRAHDLIDCIVMSRKKEASGVIFVVIFHPARAFVWLVLSVNQCGLTTAVAVMPSASLSWYWSFWHTSSFFGRPSCLRCWTRRLRQVIFIIYLSYIPNSGKSIVFRGCGLILQSIATERQIFSSTSNCCCWILQLAKCKLNIRRFKGIICVDWLQYGISSSERHMKLIASQIWTLPLELESWRSKLNWLKNALEVINRKLSTAQTLSIAGRPTLIRNAP